MDQTESSIEKGAQIMMEVGEGKMPTTAQVEKMLAKASHEVLPEASGSLSASGQELLGMAERVIDDTRKVIKQKNPHDELQELLFQIHLSREMLKEPLQEVINPIQQELRSLSEDVKSAIDDIGNIVLQLPKSGRFRRFAGDVFGIWEDVYAVLGQVAIQGVRTASEKSGDLFQAVSEVMDTAKSELEKAQADPEAIKAKDHVAEVVKDASDKLSGPVNEMVSSTVEAASKEGDKVGKDMKEVASYFPEAIIERLKDIIAQAYDEPEYQKAVDSLLSVVSRLFQDAVKLRQEVSDTTKELDEKAKAGLHCLKHVRELACKVSENLADGFSLNPVVESLSKLNLDKVDTAYFKEVGEYLKRGLRDKKYVESEAFAEDGKKLLDSGVQVFKFQDMPDLSMITGQISGYFKALKNDRLLAQYASDWSDLMSTLFLDSRGRPTLKPELLMDSVKLIGVIAERLKSIPVKRIENSTEELDYVIDHINLSTDHLKVNLFESIVSTFYDAQVSRNAQYMVRFTIGKLSTSAKDVCFSYVKKSVPKLTDTGLVDLDLGEHGLTVYFEVIPELGNKKCFFRVGKVDTNISELNMKIHDAQHEVLYTMLWPWMKSRVRTALEEGINDFVRSNLVKLDQQLVELSAATDQSQAELLPEWGSHVFDTVK